MNQIKVPVEITTQFFEFCDGCGMSEIKLDHDVLNFDDGGKMDSYKLYCDNYPICRELMRHLRNELKHTSGMDNQIHPTYEDALKVAEFNERKKR